MSRLDPADVASSSDDRKGWVYALTHIHMQGIAKIGATRKHPIQRATELSAGTGVPGMFTVAYYVATEDCFALESALHEVFSEVRVDPAREFFCVDVADVVRAARREVGSYPEEGGEWLKREIPKVALVKLPFAEMFASFPDDGSGRELTDEERSRCRALERTVSAVS